MAELLQYILFFEDTIVKTTLRIRFFHAMIENNSRNGNDRDLFFREEEDWGRYNQMKLLIVIDMQNDFIDGALGTAEAAAIVPKVIAKIKGFDGTVLATQDTHYENYLTTQEGKNLPVPHCIVNTEGWQIRKEIADLISTEPIIKETFGSSRLPERIRTLSDQEAIESITLVGLCTDICVISNAMVLKAFFPEIPIHVDASCCAGVTRESHLQALEAMKVCQMIVENE